MCGGKSDTCPLDRGGHTAHLRASRPAGRRGGNVGVIAKKVGATFSDCWIRGAMTPDCLLAWLQRTAGRLQGGARRAQRCGPAPRRDLAHSVTGGPPSGGCCPTLCGRVQRTCVLPHIGSGTRRAAARLVKRPDHIPQQFQTPGLMATLFELNQSLAACGGVVEDSHTRAPLAPSHCPPLF